MARPDFGRYQVVEEVGRGAMGVVYRASDPVIGRTVAVKAINRSYLDSMEVGADEFLERFRREAQVVGALSHPNIIKVFDLGGDYIVMEFVEGRSLGKAVKSGALDAPQALEIVADIASALDYAHGHGITHRDVKPSNIMIRSDGAVKVMDFGLARIESSELTAAGAVLGSAPYMAPEVIRGKPADARSDIFSLGVLAYEALTGIRPFPGKTVSAIMMNILREPPRAAHELNLPTQFDDLFDKVLAKEPADRYASASEFSRALKAAPKPEARALPAKADDDQPDASVLTVDADDWGPVAAEPSSTASAGSEGSDAPTMIASDATQLARGVGGAPGPATPIAAERANAPTMIASGPAPHALGETVAEPGREETPGGLSLSRGLIGCLGGGLLLACVALGVGAWLVLRSLAPEAGPSPPAQPGPGAASATAEASASAAAAAAATARQGAPRPHDALAPGVTPPRKLSGESAPLPQSTSHLELPASVLLELTVTEEGLVVQPRVMESGGRVLDEICLEAIRSWRYEPATKQGVKIRVLKRERFTFEEPG